MLVSESEQAHGACLAAAPLRPTCVLAALAHSQLVCMADNIYYLTDLDVTEKQACIPC